MTPKPKLKNQTRQAANTRSSGIRPLAFNTPAIADRRFLYEYYGNNSVDYAIELLNNKLPEAFNVVRETWANLLLPGFSMPLAENQILPEAQGWKKISDEMFASEQFRELQEACSNDEFLASVASSSIAQQIYERLPEPEEEPESVENLRDQVRGLNNLQKQLEAEGQALPEELKEEKAKLIAKGKELSRAMQEIGENAAGWLKGRFIGSLLKKAQEKVEEAEEVAEAFGWGDSPDPMRKLPDLQGQLQVLKLCQHNKILKNIIAEAGRFHKLLNQMKQKEHTTGELIRTGVELGNSLNKIMPDDLMLVARPDTKKIFNKKYCQKQLRQYHTEQKTTSEAGGVVICRDISDSMNWDGAKRRSFAGGISWAIAQEVNRQDRAVKIINYNADVQDEYSWQGRSLKEADLLKAIASYSSGGTNWMKPLDHAMEFIQESEKKSHKDRYDIILITDGSCSVSQEWIDEVLTPFKEATGTTIYGVVVESNATEELQGFCDQIIDITSFSDDEASKVLDIALK
jgi:uncharacterized protein with von Willebrand factor type A (vWA) domain